MTRDERAFQIGWIRRCVNSEAWMDLLRNRDIRHLADTIALLIDVAGSEVPSDTDE